MNKDTHEVPWLAKKRILVSAGDQAWICKVIIIINIILQAL